jgi:thiosulfate dehydrogenase [quinone] large subunit
MQVPPIEKIGKEPLLGGVLDRNTRALVVLRVCVGVLFLIFGEYKVFGTTFTLGGGFQFWINRFMQEGAYPFVVPVLRGFVLPHAKALAFLVACGELAIGLSLVSGILVRAASAAGFVYMMTLLFSSNYPGPHAPFWQYFGASLDHLVLAICFVVLMIGDSASAFSVRLKRKHN